MNESKVILIGIAGGTGSGKTTISRHIINALGQDRVMIIDQDSYYHDLGHLAPEQRAGINFDHPRAFDNDRLVTDLKQLLSGEPIEKPMYNFVTHTRMKSTLHIAPKPVIILEGILIFVEPTLRELLDIKLFVDTDADVRVLRRIKRDLHERGRSLESIERQYLEYVRPMHLEFVEPSKRWADLIVPEGGHNAVAMDLIVAKVQSLLKED
ncbi:uridine kinase [bacterium]|nr:uridine kinase [candidate division CSSED10-310 bacterium]